MVFYCWVMDLRLDYQIQKYQFCFKKKILSDPTCVSLANSQFQLNGLDFLSYTNSKYGVTITSNWKSVFRDFSSRRPDMSGYYYCRLENKLGSLQSSYIQVRDFMKIRTELPRYFNYMEKQYPLVDRVIYPTDLPFRFDCGVSQSERDPRQSESLADYLDNPMALSPFYWAICQHEDPAGAISETECVQAFRSNSNRVQLLNSFGENAVLQNGSLLLLRMTDALQRPRKVTLMCLSRYPASAGAGGGGPLFYNYYGSGALDADFSSADLTRRIPIEINPHGPEYEAASVALGPTKTFHTFKCGYFRVPPRLRAFYRASSRVQRVWKFNGQILESGARFNLTDFWLDLPPRVIPDLTGVYSLTIDSLMFEFHVTTSRPPLINSSMPAVVYLLAGENYRLEVSFTKSTCHKSLLINGYSVNIESSEKLSQSISQLPINDILTELEVQVTPYLQDGPTTTTSSLVYEVTNLRYDSSLFVGQSHYVTISCQDDEGASFSHHTIKVLPLPEVISYPIDTDCSNNMCTAENNIQINCNIPEFQYSNEGVVVKRFWYYNHWTLIFGTDEQTLSEAEKQLFRNIKLLRNNETLLVRKLGNDSRSQMDAAELLSNSVFTCRLLVLRPEILFLHSASMEDYFDPKYVIFDSLKANPFNTTGKFMKQISFPIPVSQAALWWAIILGLLLLIFLLIIIVVWRCSRPKKAEYNVQQEELDHGNDPLTELEDDEKFLNYVRGCTSDQIPPLNGYLNNVLGDDYCAEMDPVKFNEDGSFLGVYAANSARRPNNGGAKQPPTYF